MADEMSPTEVAIRAIKAEAWAEGHAAGVDHERHGRYPDEISNPYLASTTTPTTEGPR